MLASSKLGYLCGNFMQEALEKAYDADVHGEYELAKNRYKIGLDAVKEGLKQNAPETGLGPAYDNVAKWKKELNTWQQLVRDRCSLEPMPALIN